MKAIVFERGLLNRISKDDREAFRVLYQQYIPLVYHFSYSILKDSDASEEIVQCVFVNVWEKRVILNRIDNIKAYLFRVTKNLILNDLKKQQIIKKSVTHLTVENSGEENPEDQFIYKESMLLAEEAISKLSPKRKLIVELRTKQNLSLDEIADQLQISKNVVKKQFYKGTAFIKDYLIKRGRLTLLWFIMHWF
ncbi:RNA polymerase sigma-70 factor [Olivibacter sp. SDN3]|uniref:RNA polymerase sigma-70 factor n=1 Tax=Olivibacter sp. SDN3 TaxID=2764720 RepID=UPI001651573D|nr:RNA polymerase sigma-70 factor [Olivibacter sp. SDN3]QNL49373.1 RNA polymerase sigma-70 factor [Olivibacter sp. SDN3]